MSRLAKTAPALGALLLLPACAVGPIHPSTTVSLAPPIATQTVQPVAGPGQTISPDVPLPARWWETFGNAALNDLVMQALKANNDIATAEATLRQTQQQARGAKGALLPQIDAGLQSERDRTSRTMANVLVDSDQYLYSLHTAQLSVNYPLDIFGANKSRLLSARATAEVAAHRLDAARTMVVANLVTAVIQQAAVTDQLAAAQRSVESSRNALQLLERRRELGDIGDADVSAQQAALATVEGTIPVLTRQLVHQKTLIAMLIGVAPGNALPPLPGLADLTLPAQLPATLPADLVANRPDVQAAAAQMKGAGADVGTAIAARLPALRIGATIGGAAENFGDMFASGNPFWAILGAITQPIFHGGQLLHQQHAAEAALDAAKAQYRQAALQAFGDVADALAGLQTDGAALDAAMRASAAAERTLRYTQTQLKLGGVGTLTLLNASNSAAQAASQLVQARAARLTDTVAFYQAAGGRIASD